MFRDNGERYRSRLTASVHGLRDLQDILSPGGRLGKETGMWLAAEIRGLAKSLEYRGWASDPRVEPWQIARAKENLPSTHQPESDGVTKPKLWTHKKKVKRKEDSSIRTLVSYPFT